MEPALSSRTGVSFSRAEHLSAGRMSRTRTCEAHASDLQSDPFAARVIIRQRSLAGLAVRQPTVVYKATGGIPTPHAHQGAIW